MYNYAVGFRRCRMRWDAVNGRTFRAPKRMIKWGIGHGCPTDAMALDIEAIYKIRDKRKRLKPFSYRFELLLFKTRGILLVPRSEL